MTFPKVYVLQARGWEYLARGVFDTEAAAHKAAAHEGLQAGSYEVQECPYLPNPHAQESLDPHRDMPDGSARAATLREWAQIALTAVQYTQDDDEARGSDAMEVLYQNYSREEINEGGMLALMVMLSYEARALDIPLNERVEAVRSLIRDGFKFEVDNGDEGNAGAQ